jgi:AGCS family alanine or glycine:cation symporter
VLDFSDALLLSMAFPNIIGMLVLSGTVKGLVVDYRARLKSGAIHRADA